MEDTLVKWEDQYSVGIEEFDQQHKKLIDLINRFWSESTHQKDNNKILDLLLEFEAYTVKHFSSEEMYMQRVSYPALTEHKLAHAFFENRIAQEKKNITQGGDLSLDLAHFLRDWLISHIQVADKSYGAFGKAHDI